MPTNLAEKVMHVNALALGVELMSDHGHPGRPLGERIAAQEVERDETLPCSQRGRDARGAIDQELRGVLTQWGVQILGMVEGDNLFMRVKLPEGWRKKNTGHDMWTKLLDDRGRERSSFFYKGAFYDRDAFMRPNTCLTTGVRDGAWRERYSEPAGTPPFYGFIMDRFGHVIWRSEGIDAEHPRVLAALSEYRDPAHRARPDTIGYCANNVAREIAGEQLKVLYPEAGDPTAYWDEDFSAQAIHKVEP